MRKRRDRDHTPRRRDEQLPDDGYFVRYSARKQGIESHERASKDGEEPPRPSLRPAKLTRRPNWSWQPERAEDASAPVNDATAPQGRDEADVAATESPVTPSPDMPVTPSPIETKTDEAPVSETETPTTAEAGAADNTAAASADADTATADVAADAVPLLSLEAAPRRRKLPLPLRILRATGIVVLVLALGLFFFWRWLLSGAHTSLRETLPPISESYSPPPSPSATGPDPQQTQTVEASQTPAPVSEETSGVASELSEATEEDEASWPFKSRGEDLILTGRSVELTDEPTEVENTDYLVNVPQYDVKLTQILLVGVDSRDRTGQSNALSDTMMLLTVDQERDTIKLTSFQRDLLVYIPAASSPSSSMRPTSTARSSWSRR